MTKKEKTEPNEANLRSKFSNQNINSNLNKYHTFSTSNPKKSLISFT